MEIKITKEEFIKLYNEMKADDLAKKLQVEPNQIFKIVKQLGLTKKRGPKPKNNTLILED